MKIILGLIVVMALLPEDDRELYQIESSPFERCQMVYSRFPEQCDGYKTLEDLK